MSWAFTKVTSNTLLEKPATGVMSNLSDGAVISITPIFENGLQNSGRTSDLIRIGRGGGIQFGYKGEAEGEDFVSPWWGDSILYPFGGFDHAPLRGELWAAYDTERDSVIITWQDVPQGYAYDPASVVKQSYQIELIDRGEGRMEVIYRFADMNLLVDATYIGSFYLAGYERKPLYLMSADVADWDEIEGNTGVNGVWQTMYENSQRLSDPPPELRNYLGTPGDDILNGTRQGFAEIMAREGDDEITVAGRGNVVGAGLGDDVITLRESAFGNSIYGAAGDDVIILRRGSYVPSTDEWAPSGDRIYGGVGDDEIRAEGLVSWYWDWDRPTATLFGGEGDDRIIAAPAVPSILMGDEGNDMLNSGNSLETTLNGGAGDDFIMATALMEFDGGFSAIHSYYEKRSIVASGGSGADRFSTGLGKHGQAGMTILDYNPDEGDALVIDGRFASRESLALQVNGVMYFLNEFKGWDGPITSLSLHLRPLLHGIEESTLFRFENGSELDRLLVRMPGEGGIEKFTIDLLA